MFEKYPYEFYKTPEGKSIYYKWRNSAKSRCKEWDDFSTFCEWALHHKDFTATASLWKIDRDQPHSPTNSYFREGVPPAVKAVDATERELCRRWNNTVNKIRAHFGMELLGVGNSTE